MRVVSVSILGPGTMISTRHSPLARFHQSLDRKIVRHEIRSRDPDALPGGRDRQQIHQSDALASASRGAHEHLSARGPGRGRDGREVFGTVEDFALSLDPVVHEGGLQLGDRGPLQLKVRIPPVFFVLGVAEPLVRDSDAAGETDLAVHDQKFPVRSVVDARKVVPAERMVLLDLDAGGPHLFEEAAFHPAASDPVEKHVDLDACPRAFRQGVGKSLADLTGPVDVGLESNRLLCGTDRGKHGRKDLVAVLQAGDAVTVTNRWPQKIAHRLGELRIRHGVERRDALDRSSSRPSGSSSPGPSQRRSRAS